MILVRMIAPDWLKKLEPNLPKVIEGLFSDDEIAEKNANGYNVYYLPNDPDSYTNGTNVDGSDITRFSTVFVDMDLKEGTYADKDAFLQKISSNADLLPSRIVDSGNGIHAYWKVIHLDAMAYLRFQRRLCRYFKTDEAVGKICQLMRLPGSFNTKVQDNFLPCEILFEDDTVQYTAEELDYLLPPISKEDDQICQHHYDKTYNRSSAIKIEEAIPPKFGKLLLENQEVKELWAGHTDDRSMNDWRLAHLMFANDFTKEEAASVLIHSAKASRRAPIHRISYAQNIVDKIWTFEIAEDKETLELSLSVKDILSKGENISKGTRFSCHPRIDNTVHGFRLGQVLGLVAGSGVGKTAFALNMFRWFAQHNPDYDHFFIPLEQPANEIADRWKTMCGEDTALHEKVQIMSNYDENNNFRHLSLYEIQEYIKKYTKVTGRKVGCVVIDHIGVLKKKDAKGGNLELEDICHAMKSFAVETNTFLVMQSQTNREKAGIGDLELNKDAAFGTVFFESYCDYLVTLWQPLKRCHSEEACPTVTAFKFCKIRHKKAKRDIVQEDTPYFLAFDSEIEQLRDMTQDEITSFNYFLPKATNKRKADRKTEILTYQSVPYKGDNLGTQSSRPA